MFKELMGDKPTQDSLDISKIEKNLNTLDDIVNKSKNINLAVTILYQLKQTLNQKPEDFIVIAQAIEKIYNTNIKDFFKVNDLSDITIDHIDSMISHNQYDTNNNAQFGLFKRILAALRGHRNYAEIQKRITQVKKSISIIKKKNQQDFNSLVITGIDQDTFQQIYQLILSSKKISDELGKVVDDMYKKGVTNRPKLFIDPSAYPSIVNKYMKKNYLFGHSFNRNGEFNKNSKAAELTKLSSNTIKEFKYKTTQLVPLVKMLEEMSDVVTWFLDPVSGDAENHTANFETVVLELDYWSGQIYKDLSEKHEDALLVKFENASKFVSNYRQAFAHLVPFMVLSGIVRCVETLENIITACEE